MLTVSLALIVRSNLPTEARSRVYKTEGIGQKLPTKQKHRSNYRTLSTKRTNLVVKRVQSNRRYVFLNKRSLLKNPVKNKVNQSVNSVAQIDNNRRPEIGNNSTPVTNRFGATGNRPSSALWLAEIKRRYGINNPTPVTDRFNKFSRTGRKFASERWSGAIKRTYGIRSYPTPVTDRFSATGSRFSSELWRAEIKRRYGIGNAIKESVDEPE
ncbi:hypothetical protein [Floridanema evergladense]|uniref:hypothetical protein n=1 Tax=Floridanema evergladense TaxID=3396172 RepID=UPI0039A73630